MKRSTTVVSEQLIRTVEAASAHLRSVTAAEAARPRAAGKWSKQEELGHLLDSAVNNHQRIIRAQQVEHLDFPKYEQNVWVDLQGYPDSDWLELVELWRLVNRHLARIIARVPEHVLSRTCVIGPNEPVTLGFLIEDYLAHLKHHLRLMEVPGTARDSTEPDGAVSPIPAGYATATPWVITEDTMAFIDFVGTVFGATQRFPAAFTDDSNTRVAHAEVQIGDSILMLFDRDTEWQPTPAFLNVFVPDCDAVHARALAAGAVEVTPLSTNAWGDRGSRIRDPFGNLWWIQTHVEDVPEAEIERRMSEPHYLEDMRVSTETLDREMRRRGR